MTTLLPQSSTLMLSSYWAGVRRAAEKAASSAVYPPPSAASTQPSPSALPQLPHAPAPLPTVSEITLLSSYCDDLLRLSYVASCDAPGEVTQHRSPRAAQQPATHAFAHPPSIRLQAHKARFRCA
ncbi:hypothetical protein EON67_09805 [archaeon]|nr:MAG: hypothetical protein EON67_09805 [archaeon]